MHIAATISYTSKHTRIHTHTNTQSHLLIDNNAQTQRQTHTHTHILTHNHKDMPSHPPINAVFYATLNRDPFSVNVTHAQTHTHHKSKENVVRSLSPSMSCIVSVS